MMCSTQMIVMSRSFADPAQQVGGLVHLVLVEAAQALVGEQELRRRGEGLGELQLLERRRAEPVDRRRAIGGQPDQLERALGRLERLGPRVPALAVEAGEHHVLEDARAGGTAAESERCGRCRG